MDIIEAESIFNNLLLKLLLCLQAKEKFQYTSAADRQAMDKSSKRHVKKAHISQEFFLKPGNLITNPINKLKPNQPGLTSFLTLLWAGGWTKDLWGPFKLHYHAYCDVGAFLRICFKMFTCFYHAPELLKSLQRRQNNHVLIANKDDRSHSWKIWAGISSSRPGVLQQLPCVELNSSF